ncbi:MAG: Dabb family protein [Candidatus Poribacteria bacterium]|nr:Dabb family protein [Candidatus Poribacteria bacterium]
MIEHIVLLKLKSDTTEEQIQALTDALLKMGEEIPGIEDISAGMNNSPEGKNHDFTYGFIVRFRDEAARDAYLPHPVHRQVAGEYLRPIVDDVLVFDYTHTSA